MAAAAAVVLAFGCSCTSEEARIRAVVEKQMNDYPASTLSDIYKSFFQDRFGPGHMVTDRKVAERYLRNELVFSRSKRPAPYYEPAGLGDNFYRVSLAVITDSIVPFDTYFDAFMRSVQDVKPVEVAQWREEWMRIVTVVADMNLGLPDFSEDSLSVMSHLARGQYAWHHSRAYNRLYHPHYRLIRRDIFKSELLPLIEKREKKKR